MSLQQSSHLLHKSNWGLFRFAPTGVYDDEHNDDNEGNAKEWGYLQTNLSFDKDGFITIPTVDKRPALNRCSRHFHLMKQLQVSLPR